MPTIILMRHANAEPASAGMRDFDRPLSKAGLAEGNMSATALKAIGLTPTQMFCSPARRTSETLACVRDMLPLDETMIVQPQELYYGEVGAYQNLLKSLSPNDICMVIGHNPMIERFAIQLATSGDQTTLKKLKTGLPTAAIAILALPHDFSAANPHGHLLHFLTV